MMRARGIFIGALALYAMVPVVERMAPARSYQSNYDTLQARQARNASAFAVMLGEFRTSLGDMLFVKTERYLDSGIAYEPHIDERQMESKGTVEEKLDASLGSQAMAETAGIRPGTVDLHDHEHDHADGHDHEAEGDVRTLIRTANTDFRGFIGKMERHVKPWRDPKLQHQHTAGTELLPWYRLATLSDPHNVRNYMVGAWWLKMLNTPKQREEAIKFLDEGIAANPDAYELYLMKGYVLRQMDKPTEARESFSRSVEKGFNQRPPGDFQEWKNWDITDEEQLSAAMSMQIMLTRDLETTASAVKLARKYQQRLPNEGSLKRVLSELEPPE